MTFNHFNILPLPGGKVVVLKMDIIRVIDRAERLKLERSAERYKKGYARTFATGRTNKRVVAGILSAFEAGKITREAVRLWCAFVDEPLGDGDISAALCELQKDPIRVVKASGRGPGTSWTVDKEQLAKFLEP